MFRVCLFCKKLFGDADLGSIVRIFVLHLMSFIGQSKAEFMQSGGIPENLHH